MRKNLAPALRNCIHLGLTLCLIVPSYSFGADDKAKSKGKTKTTKAPAAKVEVTPDDSESTAYVNSKQMFRQLMQNSFFNQTYYQALQTLRYGPDQLNAQFFANSPL